MKKYFDNWEYKLGYYGGMSVSAVFTMLLYSKLANVWWLLPVFILWALVTDVIKSRAGADAMIDIENNSYNIHIKYLYICECFIWKSIRWNTLLIE